MHIIRANEVFARARDLERERSRRDDGSQFIKVSGFVSTRLIHAASGEVVWRNDDHNTIVNGGFAALAQCWRDPDVVAGGATFRPLQIRLGEDNTAPAATQTALFDQTFAKDIETRDVSGDNGEIVKFGILLGTGEGNNSPNTYVESGVFTEAGNMVARQTFGGVAKTGTFQLAIDWTFTFEQG